MGRRTRSRHPTPTSAARAPSSRVANCSPTPRRSPRSGPPVASSTAARTMATGSSAGSSTSCTTRSCRTRCPPTCGGRSSSSRRASSRPSTTSAGRSTAGASTTTRSSRSCGPATTSPSAASAWEASKQIGPEVADRVRELARLRNEAARELGYRDHFALALATGELDETRLFATLDDVDRATATPFAEWKAELDASLADRFGCTADELRPWHLDDPFFQDPPSAGAIALDHLFDDADLEALTVRTYDGLGLDVRPVLAGSDLYARDGKSQHAFCIDIDREGDVRVLCNVEPSERWMDTMLHEFGHAIYDRECDRTLPWLVRAARTRSRPRASRCCSAGSPAIPTWLAEVAGVDRAEVDALRPDLVARAARRSAGVRPLGARDDDLRAPALRRPRRRPRHALVGPRRAVPARPPPRRPRRTRLGRQDPPRRRARLLPELPLRRALRVAARRDPRDAHRRARRPAGGGRAARPRRVRPRGVAALGRARRRARPASP